jgi:hypothetical protein
MINIEIMTLAKELFAKMDNGKVVSSQHFKAVHKALLGKEFNNVGCQTCYPTATKEMKAKYKYILDNNLCPSCKKKEEVKPEEEPIKMIDALKGITYSVGGVEIEMVEVSSTDDSKTFGFEAITEEAFFTLTEEALEALKEQSELQKNIQKEAELLERRKKVHGKKSKKTGE